MAAVTWVAAVDLGASSGRVVVVDLASFGMRVVHRFANAPAPDAGGSLRWDWARILAEVERGLDRAIGLVPVASIGVDTWGVDYGLLDARGGLVAAPYSYRDARTAGWRVLIDRLGAGRVYTTTGVQLMAINTLCQLAVHDRDELARAKTLLMLPELLVHHLTGTVSAEVTSAGTTQLVDVATGDWSVELLEAIGVEPGVAPPIVRAPRAAGAWRGVPVHLVGGHDTASAVAALPDPSPGVAFVSSGTWSLVGAEREAVDTSEDARAANFSNEPGVCGGWRFLKNVMGLWMLDECRRLWSATRDEDLSALLAAAAGVARGGPVVDARDERFLAPPDMEAEVRAAALLSPSAGREHVVRCILDSLALAVAEVVDELEHFLGSRPPTVHVIGGGSRNAFLNRLIEDACEVAVVAGPVEATALGNALVQGIALRVFEDLGAGRRALAARATGPGAP